MSFTSGVATFTLKDGEAKTATGLPTSVGYTVAEASADGFTATKTGDTGSISTTASTAAFTNTKEEGSLVVKKTLVSDLAFDANQEFSFTVTLGNTAVNGTYGDMTFTNGVATFNLKGGETKSAVGLPKGTTYTVTETEDTGFTTTKTGDTGSIGDAAVTAEFTNTRKTGDLTVSKSVVSSTAADKTKDFTFTITLDDTTISGTYGDMTFADGVATFTLKDGQSATAAGLPVSVGYTVTEASADGFTTTKTGDTGEISTTEMAAAFTNTRDMGSLKITKTIKGAVTPEEAAGQLEFTITNETTGISETVNLTKFDFDQTTGIYTYEIEARPGDVYTVTETDYDVDGAILETVTHKIMAGPEEEGATASNIVISSTEQTQVDFEDNYKADEGVVHFTKYGYVNELCSPLADEIRPLKGVIFQAERVDDTSVVYYAQSDENGLVEFLPMEAGTYKIWEIKCPKEYVLDDTIYYVTIANGTASEITTEDGTPIEKNRIINEPLRTDIEFVKVSEGQPTLALEGSTYALFVESGDGSVALITERTTDKDGKVKFEGVLPGRSYSIKEMTSPDGYYVSKNTVRIAFKVDVDGQGQSIISVDEAALDNGDGTLVMDEQGNLTWLEPAVIARIAKVTEGGKLLAGATLRVEDEDGNVVIPEWVTGEEEAEISGKLIVGHTYRLVEVKAPAGYSLASPITFTVPDEEVAPGEERVIRVSMIDKELPPPSTPPTTNDDTPLLPLAGLMTFSLAGATVVGTKKRKMKKESKK